MADVAEHVYRYAAPSKVARAGVRSDVRLSTSGSVAAPDTFFDGFVTRPEQAAAGLLAVAQVARTRFHLPPGMVAAIVRAADPVVSSDGQGLRFESFSLCCGVYARLDLEPHGLDAAVHTTGTTNVDVNPPFRQALSSLTPHEPMHLTIGRDVTVTTTAAAVTEVRVPLSARWVRGFGEVQAVAAGMRPRLEVPAATARRFLASLPRSSSARLAGMYAVPARDGLRWSSTRVADAVPLAGPERLRVLEPLLRHATALRGYGSDEAPGASVWELDLPGARFVLTLSPGLSRGFSGEGRLLHDLADDRAAEDAGLISAVLSYQPLLDLEWLATQVSSPPSSPARLSAALTHLAAAGRVGYDCHRQAYFHRELPFDPAVLDRLHPRLAGARALQDQDQVRPDPDDPAVTHVGGHAVRTTPGGTTCSCPWYARHGTGRGPCKHILAVARR